MDFSLFVLLLFVPQLFGTHVKILSLIYERKTNDFVFDFTLGLFCGFSSYYLILKMFTSGYSLYYLGFLLIVYPIIETLVVLPTVKKLNKTKFKDNPIRRSFLFYYLVNDLYNDLTNKK